MYLLSDTYSLHLGIYCSHVRECPQKFYRLAQSLNCRPNHFRPNYIRIDFFFVYNYCIRKFTMHGAESRPNRCCLLLMLLLLLLLLLAPFEIYVCVLLHILRLRTAAFKCVCVSYLCTNLLLLLCPIDLSVNMSMYILNMI